MTTLDSAMSGAIQSPGHAIDAPVHSSVSFCIAIVRSAKASQISGMLHCSCHAFTNLVKGMVKAVRHALIQVAVRAPRPRALVAVHSV